MMIGFIGNCWECQQIFEENYVDILYFDFSNAFGTYLHYKLLVKLKTTGLNEKRKKLKYHQRYF